MNIKSGRRGGGTRLLFPLLFAGFAAYGVVLTIFGAALPRIISDFRWSYTVTGLVLAASSVGFFLSTFASGLLLEGFRPKPLYAVSVCLSAAAISLFGRWPSPVLNLLFSFAVGLSQGVVEVVTNYETVRLEREGQSRKMNLLHAGFSVGAIAGPLAVGGLLSRSGSWQLVFPGAGALLLSIAVLTAFVQFPEPEKGLHQGMESGLKLLREPVLVLLCLAMLFYVGSELGVSNWVAEYFVRVRGAPGSTAALAVSALWIGLLAGRGFLWIAWHGKRQEIVLLALSLLSTAGLLAFLAVRGSVPAMGIVFAIGLGYSGIYPLIVSLAGTAFRSTAAVGMAATAAGIGSFSFPFLLAGIAQGLGLKAGFLLLGILPLGIAVISVVLTRILPRDSRQNRST